MQAILAAAPPRIDITPRSRTIGRILTGLPVAFLVFDIALKIANPPFVVEASEQLGVPGQLAPMLAAILAACLGLYLVPRTAVLGAVLLTGYLGGAIAIHVRVGDPLFTHDLFPIYVAALLWGGLYLRDARVRALVR
jgi:DoxX-like family